MKLIAIAAVVVCILIMFKVRKEYKIALLVLGSMIFTLVEVPGIPFRSANYLLSIAFLLSELQNIRKYIRQSKGTVVWKIAGLAVLMVILVLLNSPHLRDFTSIRGFVFGELFFKYFAILYAFWSYRDEVSLYPTLKLTKIGVVILTLFGIVNLITQNALFLEEIYKGVEEVGLRSGDEMGAMFTDQDRFRVQSMFYNPFDYGYICILTLLLHIYAYSKKLENKRSLMLVAVCSLFGIVTCGCRTVFFCAVFGVIAYILIAFNPRRSFKIMTAALFLGFIVYLTFPAVNEKVNNTLSMFDPNYKEHGSSLDMRYFQYAAVLYHVQDNPLFGMGHQYFLIDLGWEDGFKGLRDDRLYGLEGVTMSYILERGFVGLFIYLVIYISLVMYCLKNKNVDRKLSALGISILAVYLLFANMTGELKSVYPTLLLLGLTIGLMETKKSKLPPPH